MTNSLSLRQCHLPGQSSFLFSKCFSRFPQSLKDQKDTFFIPAHGITIPQYPHIEIPVDISHILGNLITVIFDYQILRKPLKILSL